MISLWFEKTNGENIKFFYERSLVGFFFTWTNRKYTTESYSDLSCSVGLSLVRDGSQSSLLDFHRPVLQVLVLQKERKRNHQEKERSFRIRSWLKMLLELGMTLTTLLGKYFFLRDYPGNSEGVLRDSRVSPTWYCTSLSFHPYLSVYFSLSEFCMCFIISKDRENCKPSKSSGVL